MPLCNLHSTLSLALLALSRTASATYLDDYSYPSVPIAPTVYPSPTLISTTQNAFYPYPTSSAQNSSCHPHNTHPHPTQPHPTYVSIVHGTASLPSGYASGYPVPGESGNATYHSPGLSTSKTDVSTTALSTTASASESPDSNVSTSVAGGTTTQDLTTASQGPSPTQAEPAEPIFTASALRLPELQVWKWNIVVSVGLGLMVMWI